MMMARGLVFILLLLGAAFAAEPAEAAVAPEAEVTSVNTCPIPQRNCSRSEAWEMGINCGACFVEVFLCPFAIGAVFIAPDPASKAAAILAALITCLGPFQSCTQCVRAAHRCGDEAKERAAREHLRATMERIRRLEEILIPGNGNECEESAPDCHTPH